VVNRSGIQEVLRLELAPAEVEMLQKSADVLKDSVAAVRSSEEMSVA
jgi:malate/lactate dehydrogenase